MSETLNLYLVTDNTPECPLHWEESTSVLVWAEGWERAARMGERRYRAATGYCPIQQGIGLAVEPVLTGWKPEHDWPHEEKRRRLLRDMGWAVEGETSCDTCGLYPNDMEEFAVCPGCEQCPECGCECEEDDDGDA